MNAIDYDTEDKCILAQESQSSASPMNTDVTTLPHSSKCVSSDPRRGSKKAKALNTANKLDRTVGLFHLCTEQILESCIPRCAQQAFKQYHLRVHLRGWEGLG